MFLITGFPRSGTQYISRCLRHYGYGIAEESLKSYAHGTVSWHHAPMSDMFDVSVLQLRHPLDTIASAQTIPYNVIAKRMFPFIGKPDTDDLLETLVWAYPRWIQLAHEKASYVYKVEEIDKKYPQLFRILGLDVPSEWTKTVPTNQNTRKHDDLTWDQIKEISPKDYELIRKLPYD